MPPRSASKWPWPGRLWLALGSMALVAAGVAFGVPRVQRWRAHVEAEVALGALARCLFGTSNPSGPAELRAREIGASLRPAASAAEPAPATSSPPPMPSASSLASTNPTPSPGAAAPEADRWPARCGLPLATLYRAVAVLEAGERGRCGPGRCCPQDEACNALGQLRGLLEELSPLLRHGRIDAERVGLVLPLARAARIEPAAPPDLPGPPAPAKLLERAQLAPIDRGPSELRTDPPGGSELTLMFLQPERRARLCRLDLAAAADVGCVELAAEPAPAEAGELLGAEPGAPMRLLVAAAGGRASGASELVDGASGRRLGTVTGHPVGGYGWRDGSTAVLTLDAEPGFAALHRFGAGAAEPVVRLPLAATLTTGPELVFDELLSVERSLDGPLRLVAQRVLPHGGPFAARVDVGSLGRLAGRIEIETCRTAESMVVLLRGEPSGYHTDVAVAFRTADGWHAPLPLALESDSFGLTCYGPTASMSFVDTLAEEPLGPATAAGMAVAGRYAIDRTQCTPNGCTHQRSELGLERYSRSSRYVLADLGCSVAVLWRTPLGDVRLRQGPLETIDGEADRALFDDEAHGGFAWELGRGAVFARAGRAVLLAKTGTEAGDLSYAFELDASGGLTPLQPHD